MFALSCFVIPSLDAVNRTCLSIRLLNQPCGGRPNYTPVTVFGFERCERRDRLHNNMAFASSERGDPQNNNFGEGTRHLGQERLMGPHWSSPDPERLPMKAPNVADTLYHDVE